MSRDEVSMEQLWVLYESVNHLMVKLHMDGELDARDELVEAVDGALYGIDGGEFIEGKT